MSGNLLEKIRPKSLSEVAGLTDIVQRLEELHDAIGFCGQAFFIAGKSGTGKTTLARIIASMVSDPICIQEMDAQDVSFEGLRDYEKLCDRQPLWGDGYSLIINEAHKLSERAVSRLLTTLETKGVSKYGCVIFTTTDNGMRTLFDNKYDAMPLVSRCILLETNPSHDDYRAMAARISQVAKQHCLGDVSQSQAEHLLQSVGGSMRAAIQQLVSIGV